MDLSFLFGQGNEKHVPKALIDETAHTVLRYNNSWGRVRVTEEEMSQFEMDLVTLIQTGDMLGLLRDTEEDVKNRWELYLTLSNHESECEDELFDEFIGGMEDTALRYPEWELCALWNIKHKLGNKIAPVVLVGLLAELLYADDSHKLAKCEYLQIGSPFVSTLMSVVKLVYHTLLHDQVCLKLLDASLYSEVSRWRITHATLISRNDYLQDWGNDYGRYLTQRYFPTEATLGEWIQVVSATFKSIGWIVEGIAYSYRIRQEDGEYGAYVDNPFGVRRGLIEIIPLENFETTIERCRECSKEMYAKRPKILGRTTMTPEEAGVAMFVLKKSAELDISLEKRPTADGLGQWLKDNIEDWQESDMRDLIFESKGVVLKPRCEVNDLVESLTWAERFNWTV